MSQFTASGYASPAWCDAAIKQFAASGLPRTPVSFNPRNAHPFSPHEVAELKRGLIASKDRLAAESFSREAALYRAIEFDESDGVLYLVMGDRR
jgi:hypothetical protein